MSRDSFNVRFFCRTRHATPDPLQRLAATVGRVAQLGLAADSTVPHENATPAARSTRVARADLGCP